MAEKTNRASGANKRRLLPPGGERRHPRRARASLALAFCGASVGGLTLLRLFSFALAPGAGLSLLLSAVGALLFSLLPAALGLLALDGDQTALVRFGALAPGQIALSLVAGALFAFPAALLCGACEGIARAFGFVSASAVSPAAAPLAFGMALLLPSLLVEALLVPVCEEAFFRGYLLGVFARGGETQAALFSAALFALAHGVGPAMAGQFAFGCLLSLLTLRANSVLAAVLAHAAYNLTLVLADFAGLGALFAADTLPSCALLLLGSAAFAAVLWRVARMRPARRRARLWDGRGLSGREKALLAASAVALLLSLLVAGLTAGVKP